MPCRFGRGLRLQAEAAWRRAILARIDAPPEDLARRYIETITRVARAGRGDAELLDLVHPEAELHPIITSSILYGRDGAAAWIQAAREALVWEPTIRRIARVGTSTAVAIIHLRASRPGQGIVDSEIAWVAEFTGGLLRRAVAYPSVDDLPERAREALTRRTPRRPAGRGRRSA